MNIHDKAHELASALKESAELKEFVEINKKIEKNQNAKNMLEDFRKVQFEAYTEQMQNNELSKETQEKFQNLVTIISMNPDLAAYMQAEQRFGVIWQDVMKILSDAVEVDLK